MIEALEFFVVYGDGRKHWTAILISRVDGQRYAGDGPTPWIAVANSLEERARRIKGDDATIPPGKEVCSACEGAGVIHPAPPPHAWLRCSPCDGIGSVWKPDGPRFGAPLVLGRQRAGDIVELATGHRGRILWHVPRPTRKVAAVVTFVGLIDDFDDHESDTPTAFHSVIGVVSVASRGVAIVGEVDELHDHEKDADIVDPIARRQREAPAAADLL